ncbi:pectinesterase-like [Tasmannia lanceolata]|uniref:pectinesterase-like n=1 Tax=Tasmannia lanceolata TaxID=3420 RepID=UPI004063FE3E
MSHFHIPMSNNNLFLLFVISFFLLLAPVNSHALLLRSSCTTTRFPDLCYSSIAGIADNLVTHKDVIQATLNLTKNSVQHNYFNVERLFTRRNLTHRVRVALHDCIENIADTLHKLSKTAADVNIYPLNKSISRHHADDLNILISAAMTNQESCLDGFSHGDADGKIRKLILKGLNHVYRLCSNSLGMVRNMTNSDMANERYTSTTEEEEEKRESGFPSWLSVGDRRLLQSSTTTVTPNVVVAANGSGDYTTVQAAVEAAPSGSSERYIIKINAGVYRENVTVSSSKTNLMFIGDGRENTIITASRSVGGGETTYRSATVAVVGDGFLARDITFQNAAGPSMNQAVALRVNADLSAFYRCGMIAYQDTLYVYTQRQFYRYCYIAGTVDFIFGNAAAVFQDCDIHARVPNPGQRNMLTAQGRSDPGQNTGIVIQKCRIGATSDLQPVQSSYPTYLGRPWREYSRTVVMQTEISDVIQPAGWYPWDGDFALDTLYYAEYQNTGAGSGTENRVTWEGYRVLTTATEAEPFTADNFIDGGDWLNSTGFPYSLSL